MSKAARIVPTLAAVAEHFGVTVGTISSEWRPNGMPGKSGAWDLDAIQAWKLARPRDPDRLRLLATIDPDPLLSGDGSPALERYRLARAIAAERENDIAAGKLVPMDKFQEWFSMCVEQPIVTTLKALASKYGEDAAAMMEAAFEKAKAGFAEMEQRANE